MKVQPPIRLLAFALASALILNSSPRAANSAPVLFVTVTPSTGGTISGTFRHMVSFVGQHEGKATQSPRGGDLYIVYDDGTLRNLTAECGYGTSPGQEISVREPNVHWSGEKAIFSMVVGGTGANPPDVYFQIYEITGILQGQTAQITKLPQLENYNNIMPAYATDDSILFVTDLPASQNRDHFPQLDEYESTPCVSGLWKMNPDGTGLALLDHCPSGDFTPIVDSFGRIVFTRWDHLKRDQQADLTIDDIVLGRTYYRFPVTFPSEDSSSYAFVQYGDEVFPENGRLHPDVAGSNNPDGIPHPYWDQDFIPGMKKQDFNFFLPWAINEDGTDAEVVNHLGRHEFFNYVETSRDDLPDFFKGTPAFLRAFHQIREDPTHPGRYYGLDAAEFGTHGAGRIVSFDAPLNVNADDIAETIRFVTPYEAEDWAGGVNLTHFRDPMPRLDGTLWAAVSGTSDFADDTATDPGSPNPFPMSSNYQFKIRKLVANGEGYYEPGEALVPDIIDSITYVSNAFYPIRSVSYSGPMWELFPVEVAPRARPTPHSTALPEIERDVIHAKLGGEPGMDALRSWLIDNDLALIASRDVTVRADKQQPFNLKVAWSDHEHKEEGSTPEEVGFMQLLAARYVRGYATSNALTSLNQGRRPIAKYLSDDLNPPAGDGAPQGSVRIGEDGSMAAFVPARRAMTWQLTDPAGTPVVRERYWITFQPGEIRACTNCHGVNREDVFGGPAPTNTPQALEDLLDWWKATVGHASAKEWKEY